MINQGKSLKKLRIDLELTQAEIANRLDMTKFSYQRKETDISELTLLEAYKISLLAEKKVFMIFFLKCSSQKGY